MEPLPVVIVGSFLLAFKAVLLEGSEVAILALATVTRLGKRNVVAGVVLLSFGAYFIVSGILVALGVLP